MPSLALVEATLDREEQSYRARATGFDTKAGLVLSAAGVLVALVGTKPSVAGLIGQVFAAVAGGAAVFTIYPRVDKGIGPRQLRDRYLTRDPSITRMVLLNTRIEIHATDEERLIKKAQRFRWAALLLLSAAGAIVIGAIVSMF